MFCFALFSHSTDMTSSQLFSKLSVTGSITPSSTADGSRYSSDVSFMGLSHPASVMGATKMPSLAQSSGLTQALPRRAIHKPLETWLLCNQEEKYRPLFVHLHTVWKYNPMAWEEALFIFQLVELGSSHPISHPTLCLGLIMSPNMRVTGEVSGDREHDCVPWTKCCYFLAFHTGIAAKRTPYVKSFYFHALCYSRLSFPPQKNLQLYSQECVDALRRFVERCVYMLWEPWLAQNKLLNSEYPALPCCRGCDHFQITTRAESSPDASRSSAPSASLPVSFSPVLCCETVGSNTSGLAAECCWWGRGPGFASGHLIFLAPTERHGKSKKKLVLDGDLCECCSVWGRLMQGQISVTYFWSYVEHICPHRFENSL